MGRSDGEGKGVPVHAMKEYRVVDIELICSLGARWVGRSVSRHGLFTLGKSSVTQYTEGVCVWGRGPVWTLLRRSNPLTRIEPRSSGIQPVA